MDNSETVNFLKVERGTPEMSGGEAFGRMIGGLAICLVLILVGVAILKRVNKFVGGTSDKRLKIKERLPLSNKTSLVLVEVGGREILISVGSEAVTELKGSTLGDYTTHKGDINERGSYADNQGTLARDLSPSPIKAQSNLSNNHSHLEEELKTISEGNNYSDSNDLDIPITLNRPVIEPIDQSIIDSKVLADQLIITNPYRQ